MTPVIDYAALKIEHGLTVAPPESGKNSPSRKFLQGLKSGDSFTVKNIRERNKFIFVEWRWKIPITTRKLSPSEFIKGVREYRIHKD